MAGRITLIDNKRLLLRLKSSVLAESDNGDKQLLKSERGLSLIPGKPSLVLDRQGRRLWVTATLLK